MTTQTPTIRLHVDEAAGVLQRVTEQIRAGRLAIAGDPDAAYPIPAFEAFKDEAGRQLDFLPARDLEAIAERVVTAAAGASAALRGVMRIIPLVRKGGHNDGTSKVSGAVGRGR